MLENCLEECAELLSSMCGSEFFEGFPEEEKNSHILLFPQHVIFANWAQNLRENKCGSW